MTDLGAIANRARLVGIVALLLSIVGAWIAPAQFFRSYLLGWVLWVSVAVGCLPLIMLQHLTGGAWGLILRRLLEAGAATLPLVAVLFLPLLLGLDDLYLWARPEAVERDLILQHKAPYLNVPFFVARTALYFGIWIAIATCLGRWSLEQDRTGDVALARRMQLFSGPAIGVVGLTGTFASVDWLMSLDPHWFSTIFGMWFVAGQALAAFAFAILVLVRLCGDPPFAETLRPSIVHDLGKLLLAFVMVWAYLSFSQFLIIYSGNLPEEIPYYLDRSRGGWQWISGALIVFHFLLPFVMLLSRDLKRDARLLAGVAALVFLMRYVDLLLVIAPSARHEGFLIHWLDLALPIGLGGIWIAAYLGRLRTNPLMPLHDPYAEETFEHAAAEH